MTRAILAIAFLLGAAAVIWMGAIFVGSDALALTITAVIGGVYLLGFIELVQFRQATATLANALNKLHEPIDDLSSWLQQLHPSLQNPTQARIEGERVGLPSPIVTPYLVGLLVMLGLLGTFVGMVDTLKGAVAALQGTNELEAIRAGLAAPIQGLGLAFGTSVAGVAASAMLGLMSTLSRRERMMATRQLDQHIAGSLKNFSLSYNRQQTYQALQQQADALPAVAETLHTLSRSIEQMGQQLAETLTTNQNQFQQNVEQHYQQLATNVEHKLQTAIEANSRLAADTSKQCVDSIQPLLTQTMSSTLSSISSELSNHCEQTQQHLSAVATEQLSALSAQMLNTSNKLLEQQASSDEQRLTSFSEQLKQTQQQSNSQLSDTANSLQHSVEKIAEQQQTTMSHISDKFGVLATTLGQQWQHSSEQALAQQQQLSANWQNQAQTLAETNRLQANQLLTDIGTLLANSEQLVQRRIDTEDQWLDQHQQRMQTLTEALSCDLKTLISEEQKRSQLADQQLQNLQTSATENLSQLGRALEEPMSRLIATASETPKAAAEVIAQLREEMSNNVERDNQLLKERQQVLEQLQQLSASMQQSTFEQQQSINTLVESSGGLLQQVSVQLTEQLDNKTDTLNEISANFANSANEMASLGDAFSTAVQLFSESNTTMVDTLSHLEQSLEQSSNRSDEQLAYYVAQAREIIDHSILSQKQMLEQLQQLGRQENLFADTAD